MADRGGPCAVALKSMIEAHIVGVERLPGGDAKGRSWRGKRPIRDGIRPLATDPAVNREYGIRELQLR